MKDQYTQFEEQARALGSGMTGRGVSNEDGKYFSEASDRILYHVMEARRILTELKQYALLGVSALEMGEEVKYDPDARREFISQLGFGLEKLASEIKVPVEFKTETPKQIQIQLQ